MESKKGLLVKERGDQDGTRHLEQATVTNTIECFKHNKSLFAPVQGGCSFSVGGLLSSITQVSFKTQADRGLAIFTTCFLRSP